MASKVGTKFIKQSKGSLPREIIVKGSVTSIISQRKSCALFGSHKSAFAVIAASPLHLEISCVLEQVVSELSALLKKANQPLRQATHGAPEYPDCRL
ncbi:Cullin-associated NEDD8-dissociated protein 1 [Orobanche hederae]